MIKTIIGTSGFRVALLAAVITCLLFNSGLLVVFTPFPIYFVSLVYGRKVVRDAALIALMAVLVLYLLAFPTLYSLVDKWSLAKLIFVVPGAGLASVFGIGSAQFFGLIYFVYFLLFGYLFGEGMAKKWSLTKWFTVPVVTTLIFLIVACLVLKIAGYSVFDGMHKYMREVLNEVLAAQESAGLTGEKVFFIKKNAEQIVGYSLNVVPSVVFLIGLFVTAVNMLLAKWFVRAPGKFDNFGDIYRYSIPHCLLWVMISLGFLYFFERYFVSIGWLKYVVLNGLIGCAGIYFLQGFIILSFILRRLKSRLFKGLIFFTLFVFLQVSAPIIVLIGFTDLWIDFRRLMREEHKEKE